VVRNKGTPVIPHSSLSNKPYVRQKTAPFYFRNNFVKSFFIRIIIGTHIP